MVQYSQGRSASRGKLNQCPPNNTEKPSICTVRNAIRNGRLLIKRRFSEGILKSLLFLLTRILQFNLVSIGKLGGQKKQYPRRCRIRAYGHQTAGIPRSSGRKPSAMRARFSGVYAARSAPELREGKNSTEFFRLIHAVKGVSIMLAWAPDQWPQRIPCLSLSAKKYLMISF